MRRQIVGLDLNGRLDFAARELEDERGAAETQVIFGGSFADVITTRDGRRIGGPQARLAPHGRGGGWGSIGAPERRRPLALALDRVTFEDDTAHEENDADDIKAAADALVRDAREVVAAVPDLAIFTESRQGALIAALSRRRRSVRLLWRPVAAFLDLMDKRHITEQHLGQRFRILIHTGAGIEEQVLTLKADPDHPGHHAPERIGPGVLLAPSAGLDAMVDQIDALVEEHNDTIDWTRCERSRLAPQLLLEQVTAGEVEILRSQNGNWLHVLAPRVEFSDLGIEEIDTPPAGHDVAATFLVTPLAHRFARALAAIIAPATSAITIIDARAVARGCLRAGRLIERGLPHYFDRLEPVAIAVLRDGEPAFKHLIRPEEVVPANREHVSAPLEGFNWGRDRTETEFYILKGEAEVRHWLVERSPAPTSNMPVSLRIRQTPGQSWANLAVSSTEWEALSRAPIVLDWERLTPSPLTPDEVLELLRAPPPPIPERIVEQAHIDLWRGGSWAGQGRAIALARIAREGGTIVPNAWGAVLARSLPAPSGRYWHVGTDGELPTDLPVETREGFDIAMQHIAETLCAATLHRPPRYNGPLMAMTWCFTRCPDAVQDLVLDAIQAVLDEQPHPLLAPSTARTVVIQGAGRSLSGVDRLSRLFCALDQMDLNTNSLNALAMALTRRDKAPAALSRELVDRFQKRLGAELIERINDRNFKVRFQNTLSAIAGLFRWRIQEPYALLASTDPVATELRKTLVTARDMLQHSSAHIPQLERKLQMIDKIIEYLDGTGDPNILRFIET